MFERFTEQSRQVITLAEEEARGLMHNYIGAEHLLLGLLREEEGIAGESLKELSVTVGYVRAEIRKIIGVGDSSIGQIPFTPRAKKILELSLREALSLGHNYVGTEHLLLGLMRDGGHASGILEGLGCDTEVVRAKVTGFLMRRSAAVLEAKDDEVEELETTPASESARPQMWVVVTEAIVDGSFYRRTDKIGAEDPTRAVDQVLVILRAFGKSISHVSAQAWKA